MRARSRWEVLYTDDGLGLKDRKTGCELEVRKMYGYPSWSVTVWQLEQYVGGWRKNLVHADSGYPRRSRPTRAELAVLVDSLV